MRFGKSMIPAVARRAVHQLEFAKTLKDARREVREIVPVCPGVYGWFNREGTLLYVGKSKSLRHRLTSDRPGFNGMTCALGAHGKQERGLTD